MLCGCIRVRSKPEAFSKSLEPFDRSAAPSPPERPDTRDRVSIVTPEREAIMEPTVKSRFQVLGKID
jgi:hypothetical protein